MKPFILHLAEARATRSPAARNLPPSTAGMDTGLHRLSTEGEGACQFLPLLLSLADSGMQVAFAQASARSALSSVSLLVGRGSQSGAKEKQQRTLGHKVLSSELRIILQSKPTPLFLLYLSYLSVIQC